MRRDRSVISRGPFRVLWLATLACLGLVPSLAASQPRAAPNAVITTPSPALPRQQILRRALQSDPAQEYLLYLPANLTAGASVFVTVHGISLNVEEHAKLFAPYAEASGVVLVAPAFTGDSNDDYQRLGRAGRGTRSDRVLEAILNEVHSLTGADIHRFALFGFSGGAQFAHRYVMAHPERVSRAAVGAAGWYMFPDPRLPYPYGLGSSDELSDVHFDPNLFLRVPITVFVGRDDIGEKNVDMSEQVVQLQGRTRLERAERWTAAMRRAATERGMTPVVQCVEVSGIHHSFSQFMLKGQLGERVFGFLYADAASVSAGSTRGAR